MREVETAILAGLSEWAFGAGSDARGVWATHGQTADKSGAQKKPGHDSPGATTTRGEW